MGLLDRVRTEVAGRTLARAAVREARGQVEQRYAADLLIDMWAQAGAYGYGGQVYGTVPGLNQTMPGARVQPVPHNLFGYMAALRGCPPAFAAQLVRAQVLSQMQFQFRSARAAGPNRSVFGSPSLSLLETPWPNGTTGELIAQMEWHAGVAGNAFVARRPDRLRVLLPDWVGVLYGSQMEPDYPEHALDGELLGYVYMNQGWAAGDVRNVHTLLPNEVAHWSPLPDPINPGLGMSWLTPAVRDIQLDSAASDHKIQYFRNGATPNLVVKGIPAIDPDQFQAIVDKMEATHAGVANAYRTLYLTAGADATVVGSNLAETDLKALQGFTETRISFLSRVPAPLLGITEGLAGSSLNAGNYAQAKRTFADLWVHPQMQDLCGALGTIVDPPVKGPPADLWYDAVDVPLLREDAKDAAEITQIQASTVGQLVKDGFTRDSAVAAVTSQNMNLLKPDPNWVSVQLQAGTGQAAAGNGTGGGG